MNFGKFNPILDAKKTREIYLDLSGVSVINGHFTKMHVDFTHISHICNY